GVAALYVTGQRPVEPASAPGTTLPLPTEYPRWFDVLSGLMPEGFDHIALLASQDEFVGFEAFDLTTGRFLEITVGRVPGEPHPYRAIPLEQARSMPWTDAHLAYHVS